MDTRTAEASDVDVEIVADAHAHPVTRGGVEGRTRHAVARLLLEEGPITAAAVAERLGISVVAVRRHIDVLVADGHATSRNAPKGASRGRGRPARLFLLTEAGRAGFGHAYDDIAVAALRYLAERGALGGFIEQRVNDLLGPHRADILAEDDPADRARALARALTAEGYAASAREVGVGAQLCQHHCPVAHVAAEFPRLCEAEAEAFAEVLGIHVQRLATIARGDAVCTTHIPLPHRNRHTPPVTVPEVPGERKDGGEPA